MFSQVEHDYIASTMENNEASYPLSKNRNNGLKTELSLGLPGSETPEKKHGVTIFGKDFEASVSGKGSSKRGFEKVIGDSEKWVLGINGGSCGNFGKDCVLSGENGRNLGEGNIVTSSPGIGLQKKGCDENVGVENGCAPNAKAQVVGWPPIRSFRKNSMASTNAKNNVNPEEKSMSECLYVKVSMDGAPYLRKVDLQIYGNYMELSSALEKMFNCFISGQYGSRGHSKRDKSDGHATEYLRTSENVLTYEDKDGDWMLVGDVPWKMFRGNCRKLRIMKGSEAIGLAPNAAEKCKVQT